MKVFTNGCRKLLGKYIREKKTTHPSEMKGGTLKDGLPGHVDEADPGVLGPGDDGAVPGVGEEPDGEDVAGMIGAQLHHLPARLPVPENHSLVKEIIRNNRKIIPCNTWASNNCV